MLYIMYCRWRNILLSFTLRNTVRWWTFFPEPQSIFIPERLHLSKVLFLKPIIWLVSSCCFFLATVPTFFLDVLLPSNSTWAHIFNRFSTCYNTEYNDLQISRTFLFHNRTVVVKAKVDWSFLLQWLPARTHLNDAFCDLFLWDTWQSSTPLLGLPLNQSPMASPIHIKFYYWFLHISSSLLLYCIVTRAQCVHALGLCSRCVARDSPLSETFTMFPCIFEQCL